MLLSGNLFQTPALVLHSSGMAVICSSGNVGKGQSAVFFFGPPDIPFVFKSKTDTSLSRTMVELVRLSFPSST